MKSVTFLENFNKDTDMSLHYDKNIYKGVAIEFDNDYVIQEKDIAWLHPNLTQTTAIYEEGEFTKVKEGYDELAPFNSCAGIYNIHSIDEIGTPMVKKYTIVHTYSEGDVSDIHKQIIGKTIKEAYDILNTQKVDDMPNLKEKNIIFM